jgi:hypothetical protein
MLTLKSLTCGCPARSPPLTVIYRGCHSVLARGWHDVGTSTDRSALADGWMLESDARLLEAARGGQGGGPRPDERRTDGNRYAVMTRL